MKKNSLLKTKRQRGFTLLELLVVVSIISILLALGVVAFSTAQRKSRDAKRQGDIKAMQDGFEQFYAVEGSYDGACAAGSEYFPGGLPVDPKDQTAYACDDGEDDYCVCATLETGGGNATSVSCDDYGSTSDGDYYCLTNLQ